MKHHIKKVLLTPKLAIGIASGIAVVVGITAVVMHQRTQAERFAEINGIQPSVISGYDNSKTPKDIVLAFPVGGRVKSVSVKIGDTVTAGTVLASLDAGNAIGAINQAKAAYLVAKTAYDRLVSGASTPDIEVTQAAVDSASTALDNAKQNLVRDITTAHNSVNSAVVANTNVLFSNPQSTSLQFNFPGTVQTNQQLVINVTNERIKINADLDAWQNEIASLNSSNVDAVVSDSVAYMGTVRSYLTDVITLLSSYTQATAGGSQSTITAALGGVTSAKASVDGAYLSVTNDVQQIKSAKAGLDQAKASLALKQAPARTEDVAIAAAQVQSTQGALQIAQSVYNNMLIIAPVDGKIINVSVTAGQIATPNTGAIEIVSQ